MYSKLQYITQGKTAEEQIQNIREALDAGCVWIQLRWKNASENKLISLGNEVRKMCSDYRAAFILNDHVEMARAIDADGVHLGLSDCDIRMARRILGENKIIGGTAN